MNKYLLAVIALIIGFALGFLAYPQLKAEKPQETSVKADTITYVDTVKYKKPIVKDSIILRYKTWTDTITVHAVDCDTTVIAEVALPVTQKQYQDSTYHAWVSGIEPQLDSIHVYNTTTTIEKSITVTQKKNPHWGIGIQAGGGYSLKGFTPYIGVGIQYNLFTW